jgi:hypothetical protein
MSISVSGRVDSLLGTQFGDTSCGMGDRDGEAVRQHFPDLSGDLAIVEEDSLSFTNADEGLVERAGNTRALNKIASVIEYSIPSEHLAFDHIEHVSWFQQHGLRHGGQDADPGFANPLRLSTQLEVGAFADIRSAHPLAQTGIRGNTDDFESPGTPPCILQLDVIAFSDLAQQVPSKRDAVPLQTRLHWLP